MIFIKIYLLIGCLFAVMSMITVFKEFNKDDIRQDLEKLENYKLGKQAKRILISGFIIGALSNTILWPYWLYVGLYQK